MWGAVSGRARAFRYCAWCMSEEARLGGDDGRAEGSHGMTEGRQRGGWEVDWIDE